MKSDTERLISVFSAIFVDLEPGEITMLSMVSNPRWDSLASLTLLSLVQEEYQVDIPVEDMEILTSFELIADYLQTIHSDD